MSLPRFQFTGADGKQVAGEVLLHDALTLRLRVDTVAGKRLRKPFEEHGPADELPKGWIMETLERAPDPLEEYRRFVLKKRVVAALAGFEVAEDALNPHLFPYQRSITRRALRLGRSAIFAACGLGKTLMQLSWAEPVTRHTNLPVLVLAPLNVVRQTVSEGARFGIPVTPCRSQADVCAGVNITNYEMLDHFDASAFGGVVLDESSLIKNWTGKTREKLETAFDQTPYKLCCTATPAPNDHLELGNHAQFLRVMQSGEMLSRWFINDTMRAGGYRLKAHAAEDFWRWMASWAATLERPSDLGFSDEGFDIPPLEIIAHTIDAGMPPCADGELFGNATLSATTLHREMRRTAAARSEEVARIVNGNRETWVVWCNTNYEADELAARIPDAVDVRGSMAPKQKEQALADFVEGRTRILLTKPAIGGYGLNLQYVCHKMVFVGLSYSYEDFHQCLCRSWRFGQAHTVEAHLVAAETEGAIRSAIDRKRAAHREMHQAMVKAMRQVEMSAENGQIGLLGYDARMKMELPHWLKGKH